MSAYRAVTRGLGRAMTGVRTIARRAGRNVRMRGMARVLGMFGMLRVVRMIPLFRLVHENNSLCA
jgi:hypothetical protein